MCKGLLGGVRSLTAALLLGAALLCSIGCLSCQRPAGGPEKLNVVLVLSDALRAASLPMYGYPRNTAPRLSELAQESIVFDSHLAHYPGTSVSVSQLHTGRLMSPLLISYKYIAVPVRGIPPDLLVLPREFHAAGYRTGIISSHYWFRGDDSRMLLRYYESQAIVRAHGDESYASFEDLWPALTKFLDDSTADRRPFFLYLHTLDTHGPHTYHPGFDAYRNAPDWPEAYNLYDSTILYTDHWVGKLVDELRARGLLDHTIFVFTADHGEEFNEMGPERWNGHHGPVMRRNLMHVPLIMRIPGHRTTPRRYEGLTRHIDVAPTLLRLAVADLDLHRFRCDGEDMSDELLHGGNGQATQRASIAYSPRYWGLFRRDFELHYDQWTDTFSSLLRPVPDVHNYPRLEPVDEPKLRAELMEELRRTYDTRTEEFLALPPNDELPSPALLGLMLPVMGVEGARADGVSSPTFEDRADDNRWALGEGPLECHPSEQPAPLTIFTPWVPGTYRVSVVLHQPGIRQGYENRFRLQFLGSGNQPVDLRGADATADALLDAGVQTLGAKLELQISEARGGVSIAGLKIERLDAHTPQVEPDAALKERLRALGYGN